MGNRPTSSRSCGEENRVLKARLAGQRLRFEDGEPRRLAELGHRLGRRVLARVATVVTPGTHPPLASRTRPAERERNHQGLANELIEQPPAQRVTGAVRRRQRVGGILNFYYRSAA
jgi:hypothetical protein